MAKRRLGDILEAAGVITPDQLQQALRIQERTRERLGDILIQQGMITERQLMGALEEQLGIPQVRLGVHRPEPQALAAVPEALARRYMVLPLRRDRSRIVLAMADPLDYFAIDDIRMTTGLAVQPVIASKDELRAAVERYYGMRESVEEANRSAPEAADAQPDEVVDETSPVVRLVNRILSQAVLARASDLHFDPDAHGLHVRIRVDGVMRLEQTLPKQLQGVVAARIKVMSQLNVAERRLPQDGYFRTRIQSRDVDVRVSTLPTMHGEKIVLRLFDAASGLFSLDQLDFAPAQLRTVKEMLARSHGMVLVTGPTGSGKTSTLYAALAACNRPEVNIITIEDPVEYQLAGINQVAVNPAAGLTFSAGLRAILRQDPDIVMVGEIRDGETAQIAVRAALTGHLVLSTLHTSGAVQAVARLVDMGIEPYLVASAVSCVISQRLVRRICPECKVPHEPNEAEREWLARQRPVGAGGPAADAGAEVVGAGPDGDSAAWQGPFYAGRGCGACAGTGYLGRMAIQEVLRVDEEMRRLIARGAAEPDLADHARRRGFINLAQDGLTKAAAGQTSLAEVMRVAWYD
ncbi:MAG: Flp pilus assembly complex ATPase component TadA [Alicyclobacillaceae bacterium]|nr:Flp pilus assembly complex ATPase component TadA [Alicyclobacillaceae bacterium]